MLELLLKLNLMFELSSLLARVVGGWLGGGWVLDFTRLMLISTQVEVVVEVGVELGNDILSYADISAYIFPNQISAYYVIVIVAKPNLLLVASSELRKNY